MKKIENILEKYFEGQTSLKEEEMLRNYFQEKDIPEHLQKYIPLFRFFTEERKGKNIEKQKFNLKRTVIFRIGVGVAASVILFISVRSFFIIENQLPSESTVYVNGIKYTDIQMINIQTLDALDNITEQNGDLISSQIDILNSFSDL